MSRRKKIQETIEKENKYLESLKNRNFPLFNYFEYGIRILERLEEKHYEAYFVGGVVRDFLMKVDFNDIDICTTATPKQIQEMFPNADLRYQEFGNVTVNEGNFRFDITTFRQEKYERKKVRKPSSVKFSKKLSEDIERRDFTINAIALDARLKIIDYKNGYRDLKRRVIKVIGNGTIKFREDPLRILRGIDLVARYNFNVNNRTLRSMRKSSDGIADLSAELRINELLRILETKYSTSAIVTMLDGRIFKHNPIYEKWLQLVFRNNKKLTIEEKIALLFFLLDESPKPTYLKEYDYDIIKEIIDVAKILENNKVDNLMLFYHGIGIITSADIIAALCNKKYKRQKRLLAKIDRNMIIRDKRDLNFRPTDVIELFNGQTGPNIRLIYNQLLELVVCGELRNTYPLIREKAIKLVNEELSKSTIEYCGQRNTESAQNISVSTNTTLQQKELEDVLYTDTSVEDIPEQDNFVTTQSMIAEYNYLFQQEFVKYCNTNLGPNVTEQDRIDLVRKLGPQISNKLIAENPKFNILVERGLI